MQAVLRMCAEHASTRPDVIGSRNSELRSVSLVSTGTCNSNDLSQAQPQLFLTTVRLRMQAIERK